jgi:hypothetical protein
VITLLLTHLDAAGVAASLRQFPATARVLVCHGGDRRDFEAVEHEDKLFIDDPSLRGPLEGQSYAHVLSTAYTEAIAGDPSIDLVFLAEYDHVVLRDDFEHALRRTIDHAGADFVAKSCSPKDDTNWPHALRERHNPALRRLIGREGELWGCLGTGMLMRRDALAAFAAVDHVHAYLELYVPTVMRHLGARLDDVDRFSDLYAHVNAPPEKDAASVREAASQGHFFVHPFKRVHEVDQLRR